MSALREQMLAGLGIKPVWRLRSLAAEARHDVAVDGSVLEAAPRDTEQRPASAQPAAAPSPPALSASARDAREAVQSILAGKPAEPAQPVLKTPPVSGSVADADIAAMDWDALEAEIRQCTRCGLCQQRKQAVPGVGDRRADWMIVGEGPGAEEDRLGEPFVGPAGKLLDAMLAALDLSRGQGAYIANAVKCRPPGNRTPEPEEIQACLPFLQRQIELVGPRVILALGRPAAQSLLQQEIRIGPARGKRFAYREIPVVVSYHPAYLLRTPEDKAKAWEDLCRAQDLMHDAQRSG